MKKKIALIINILLIAFVLCVKLFNGENVHFDIFISIVLLVCTIVLKENNIQKWYIVGVSTYLYMNIFAFVTSLYELNDIIGIIILVPIAIAAVYSLVGFLKSYYELCTKNKK